MTSAMTHWLVRSVLPLTAASRRALNCASVIPCGCCVSKMPFIVSTSLGRLDFGALDVVSQGGLEVRFIALVLLADQELLEAMCGLDHLVGRAREVHLDERENHGLLQVGSQRLGHLAVDKVVDCGYTEALARVDKALPGGVPKAHAAVVDGRVDRLDDRDDRVASLGHETHLDHPASAGAYLDEGAVQLHQAALAREVVGDGDRLPVEVVVHHVESVSAREQRENVSRLGCEQVSNRASNPCRWQECHRQEEDGEEVPHSFSWSRTVA